jgi:MSHA pilin protein MshD
MALLAPSSSLPLRRLRGFTLVELLLFIVVVSGALAGVLAVFVQAGSKSADPAVQRQALAVAESLLEEVLLMPYTYCDGDDANVGTATAGAGCAGGADASGPEPGEGRYAVPQFDHVNDYHGTTLGSGIVNIANAAVPGLAAYSASVSVSAATLNTITAASGDALRVTVTVTGPGGISISLDGYRSRHAPNSSL